MHILGTEFCTFRTLMTDAFGEFENEVKVTKVSSAPISAQGICIQI